MLKKKEKSKTNRARQFQQQQTIYKIKETDNVKKVVSKSGTRTELEADKNWLFLSNWNGIETFNLLNKGPWIKPESVHVKKNWTWNGREPYSKKFANPKS